MMNARGGSKIWLIGGLVAIVVLITATYLLAVKPVYDETAATQTQIADKELEKSRLNKKLGELNAQFAKRASYNADLKAKQLQLPDSYDIPGFLSQLSRTDSAVRVDNNSIAVADPIEVDKAATVVAVPITLAAKGNVPSLIRFVSRLQNTQSRAVLLKSVSVQSPLQSDSDPTINVSLVAFCNKNDEDDCQVTKG